MADFKLLPPDVLGALNSLADPELTVSKPLIGHTRPDKFDLVQSLCPPAGTHSELVAVRFAFELMPGVSHELGIMTRWLGTMAEPLFVFGFIVFSDVQKLRDDSKMEVDSSHLWTCVNVAHILLSKELYALIEEVHEADLQDARSHPRTSSVRNGIR